MWVTGSRKQWGILVGFCAQGVCYTEVRYCRLLHDETAELLCVSPPEAVAYQGWVRCGENVSPTLSSGCCLNSVRKPVNR